MITSSNNKLIMKIFLFATFLGASIILQGQESVSNADLSRKLDLILGKINGLEERVSKLENDNSEVKKEIQAVQKTANEAKTASQVVAIPQDEEDKKSFMSRLRLELNSEDDKAAGAWTKEQTWGGMRRNLTMFKVRKLLGNPTRMTLSLDPRIDRIYHYEGDLDADGTEEVGRVSFFRDRVISFSSPFGG